MQLSAETVSLFDTKYTTRLWSTIFLHVPKITRMDDFMKIVKKWDIIIIIILLVISFIPYIIFINSKEAKSDESYAVISIAGKEYKKVRLDNNVKDEEFTINTKDGINVVKIVKNKIAIIDADCPDRICELPGFISNVGERLVCLPHKLVIEIKGTTNSNVEEDIISR